MHPAVRDYLQQHWGAFTAEELRSKLLAAGYPSAFVEEGIREFARPQGEGRLFTRSQTGDWLIGFFGPVLLALLGPFAVIGYVVALVYTWRRYPHVRRGLLWATVVGAALAVLFLLYLFNCFNGCPNSGFFGLFR